MFLVTAVGLTTAVDNDWFIKTKLNDDESANQYSLQNNELDKLIYQIFNSTQDVEKPPQTIQVEELIHSIFNSTNDNSVATDYNVIDGIQEFSLNLYKVI